MNKKYIPSVLSAILISTSMYSNAEVEMVISSTVSDPEGYITKIDSYVATGEMKWQSVNLMQHIVDGTDASTHTVVVIYKDMKALEKILDQQATSATWASWLRSLSSIRTVNDNLLAIQRKTWGKGGWSEGDYLAAMAVNVPDQYLWLDALDELQNNLKVKMPGMVRVVRLRGAPTSHAVLITAPNYAGLIEYMEAVEASTQFAEYRSKSKTRPVGSTIYKVVKVWK